MREFINLVEDVGGNLQALMSQKDKLIAGLQLDERSAATILEMDDDDPDLASVFFDNLMATYRRIVSYGYAPIYRHMLVPDFAEFIEALQDGSGHLGTHWSINPDIESPTWEQDQRGTVPVYITGKIKAAQIDWEATLRQNFEWPHEMEMIFVGGVFVERIEDRDEDEEVSFNRELPR